MSNFNTRFAAALLVDTASLGFATTAGAEEIDGDGGYECVLNNDTAMSNTTATATAHGEDALACGEDARVGDNASVSAGVGVGFNSGEVGARGGFQVAW
ncbi:YadA-like family protein [Alteriqipengyuania flavescens]|uniref:YadA-like family protein n=1 Tax=Alteriqipengyuania flavescens TaxID=3053610 RepID=UPI0025B54788|nr:YadA-like family protein [Alteriqipengyuania flavescens]WJY19212.1 YadA-like family protein [Alteriqipengyuania flavescens]WJY25152.1 YadA-like family protein [Alteriqipengyuania flavescens]